MTTYLTHVISTDEHKDLAGDRASLRRGTLGADEIKLLDDISPGWSLSKFDHSWNRKAIAAADFYEREAVHPRERSGDPHEAGLGGWMGTQRTNLKNGILRPDRRAWLDEHYPTWNETLDDAWRRAACAVADFYSHEGRRPSRVSKEPIEKELGEWLNTQRKAFRNGTLRPDRRAWLDEHYPTWNETFDAIWYRSALSVTSHYKCEGRHPSRFSESTEEKMLGEWLNTQRKAFKNNTLRPDRRAWLDEHYPTWTIARP